VFVYLRLPEDHARYYLPPLPNPDPEIPYGIVFLANRRIMKRCFQAVVRYLDPQSVMKLRMTTKEINREGERAMYRVWRYLVAVNYSSPFITLPAVVGGTTGQTRYTRAVYDLFFANKHQEVLIMGGFEGHVCTNNVTKMIIEQDGTIRFEASTPMLQARNFHGVVYHQGEVISVSSNGGTGSGVTERLDTLTQKQAQLAERLPHHLRLAAAVMDDDNQLLTIGGIHDLAGQNVVSSDIVYQLNEGEWRERAARLNKARWGATAAIVLRGKLIVCGGSGCNKSVECFDPSIGVWQEEGEMTCERRNFLLFVLKNEVYAVGGNSGNTSIEKRNEVTKQWEHVSHCGLDRYGCAAVLVGSKVFLFGGNKHKSTFDFFDLETKKWASQDVGCAYFDEAKRQLLRQVHGSKAVLITPPAALTKEWTDLNVVKLEDRDTARFDDRFEATTGKAILWQWNA